jgi:hypothetical protein
MAKAKLVGTRTVQFYCAGCGYPHSIGIGDSRPSWEFDGDYESPTISPSILVRGIRHDIDELPQDLQDEYERVCQQPNGFDAALADKRFHTVCHSFVKNGMIQYLNDCTHSLSGQTLTLQDIPEDESIN